MEEMDVPIQFSRPRARAAQIFEKLLLVAVVGLCLNSSPLRAQSFLEKLESAVRERLSDAQANPDTSNTQSGSQLNNSTASGAEELPSPQSGTTSGAPQPSNAPSNTLPSILEGSSQNSLPAIAPVPPPMLGRPGVDSNSAGAGEPERRIYLGLEAEEVVGGGIGVRVTSVAQDSPAWKAGFQRGDRIMGINGFAIANLDDMVKQFAKTYPGQSVKFLVSRADRNLELVAVLMEAGLAERIAGTSLPLGALDGSLPQGPPWLGVSVNDLTAAFRNQFGLTIFRGAAVTSVSPNSPAAKVGIAAGDVITAVGGIPIETAQELMDWMRSARPGLSSDISYQRGSSSRTVQLTLEVHPQAQVARSTNRRQPIGPVASPLDDSLYNGPTLESPLGAANTALPANPVEVAVDVAELTQLRSQVANLQSELDATRQRLEATQIKLRQILEGLDKAQQ
jgi:S1-C subfamily serine protease